VYAHVVLQSMHLKLAFDNTYYHYCVQNIVIFYQGKTPLVSKFQSELYVLLYTVVDIVIVKLMCCTPCCERECGQALYIRSSTSLLLS